MVGLGYPPSVSTDFYILDKIQVHEGNTTVLVEDRVTNMGYKSYVPVYTDWVQGS